MSPVDVVISYHDTLHNIMCTVQTCHVHTYNLCTYVCNSRIILTYVHMYSTYVLYSGKFSWDKIFMDFAVALSSTQNKVHKLGIIVLSFCTVSQHLRKFYLRISFLEPSAEILSHKNFPLYGILLSTVSVCDLQGQRSIVRQAVRYNSFIVF